MFRIVSEIIPLWLFHRVYSVLPVLLCRIRRVLPCLRCVYSAMYITMCPAVGSAGSMLAVVYSNSEVCVQIRLSLSEFGDVYFITMNIRCVYSAVSIKYIPM